MNYEKFKEELAKQIKLNMDYFNSIEIKLLFDFSETINKEDFEDEKNE